MDRVHIQFFGLPPSHKKKEIKEGDAVEPRQLELWKETKNSGV